MKAAGTPAHSEEKRTMLTIQFFDNGADGECLETVKRIEAAGYDVEFAPTSGPPALWINNYELIGGTAIRNVADQLINAQNNIP